MQNKELKSILQDALENEYPASHIDLLPKVKERLVARNIQQGEKMNKVSPQRVSKAGLVIAAVITLLVIAVITPQGRAVAQKMFQFFAVSEEKSFPIPTEQVYPPPETPTPASVHALPLATVDNTHPPVTTQTVDPSCSTFASQAEYFCQIRAVEAQAGFDAKEFLYDPKNLKFSKADFVPESGEIMMEFVTGGGALYLRQGRGDFPLPKGNWGKVPADAVEPVTVNGQYGEIVLGMFVVHPNATEAVWEPGGQLSLAWREGDRWFSLEKFGDPYPIEWITKDELIKLAESLVNERPAGMVPPLDPENLTTIEQAEALAGFDIPSPTQLPEGYELKRIVWMDHTIRLMYGPKDSGAELFIFIGQGVNNQNGPCLECPAGVTETVQVGPWRGWYWRGAFNASATAAPGEASPTPIWEGDYAHWSLVWNTDRYWLSMFYNPPFNSGKEMNKETMIQIAESLK